MSTTEEARYTITERPAAVGGGWTLKLYLGEEEMGGGVFPPDPDADTTEQAWIWAYNAAFEVGDDWVLSHQ